MYNAKVSYKKEMNEEWIIISCSPEEDIQLGMEMECEKSRRKFHIKKILQRIVIWIQRLLKKSMVISKCKN